MIPSNYGRQQESFQSPKKGSVSLRCSKGFVDSMKFDHNKRPFKNNDVLYNIKTWHSTLLDCWCYDSGCCSQGLDSRASHFHPAGQHVVTLSVMCVIRYSPFVLYHVIKFRPVYNQRFFFLECNCMVTNRWEVAGLNVDPITAQQTPFNEN